MKYAVEILKEVLGVGWQDIEKLDELVDFANRLEVDWKSVIYFTCLPDENIDRDSLIDMFQSILFNLMLAITEKVQNDLNIEIKNDFIVNYMDTWFNNFLDEVMYIALEKDLYKKEIYDLILNLKQIKEVNNVCR